MHYLSFTISTKGTDNDRVTAVLPQVVVIGLTLGKYATALHAGWGRAPIVFRLIRDGTSLVLALFSTYVMPITDFPTS